VESLYASLLGFDPLLLLLLLFLLLLLLPLPRQPLPLPLLLLLLLLQLLLLLLLLKFIFKSHSSCSGLVVVWHTGSASVLISEVNRRQALLVLRWVIVSGFSF